MVGIGQAAIGAVPFGGITVLGVNRTSAGATPVAASDLDAQYSATPVAASTTATPQAIPPVILQPRNLSVVYDEQAKEFRSNWFPKRVPSEGERCLCLTAAFRENITPDPIEVIVERDDDGDNQPDGATRRLEVGPQTGITLLSESATDFAFREDARYRVRFPSYAQADVVTRAHLAVTIDARDRLKEAWPLEIVSAYEEPLTDVFDVLGTSLTREAARVDEEYDQTFIATASGQELEQHAREIGLNRRVAETDRELRIRTQVTKAAATTSATPDELAQALRIIFGPAAQSVSVRDATGKAAIVVTIPKPITDETPLTPAQIEDLLQSATSIGEGVVVIVEGTFEFDGPEGTGFGSGGLSRRIIE